MSDSPPAPRTGHPYYMHDAIYAQPGALRLVARGQADAIEAAALRLRGLDHVLLTGVGTSWHAALVGELLFARLGGLGLRRARLPRLRARELLARAAGRAGVVVLSHGGTRRYSREALSAREGERRHRGRHHRQGPEAPEEADWTLRTVDQESSGAHTVSYTAALALLAKLAVRGRRQGRDRAKHRRHSRHAGLPARARVVGRPGRALRRKALLLVRRRRAQHGDGVGGGAEDERGQPRAGGRLQLRAVPARRVGGARARRRRVR